MAIAVALADAAPAHPASISVTADRRGDRIDINASAVLTADAATEWRVLTDYDWYTQFILLGRIEQIAVRRNVESEFRAMAEEIVRRGVAGTTQDIPVSR